MGEREGAGAELAAAETLRAAGSRVARKIDAQLLSVRSQLARTQGDIESGVALQRAAVEATLRAVDTSPHRARSAADVQRRAVLGSYPTDALHTVRWRERGPASFAFKALLAIGTVQSGRSQRRQSGELTPPAAKRPGPIAIVEAH